MPVYSARPFRARSLPGGLAAMAVAGLFLSGCANPESTPSAPGGTAAAGASQVVKTDGAGAPPARRSSTGRPRST
jgi:hypothetical protein